MLNAADRDSRFDNSRPRTRSGTGPPGVDLSSLAFDFHLAPQVRNSGKGRLSTSRVLIWRMSGKLASFEGAASAPERNRTCEPTPIVGSETARSSNAPIDQKPGPPLGAEVRGIDLSQPLARNDLDAIEEAWRTRLVVVAHGQSLFDPQLLAFSRCFGELDPPGPNPYGEPYNKEFPEINVISNVVEDGKPIDGLGDGEAVWHADMTYIDVPPKAAVLYSLGGPFDQLVGLCRRETWRWRSNRPQCLQALSDQADWRS